MANNRLFLTCSTCKPADGSREIMLRTADSWRIMIAKFYPGTGWLLCHDSNDAVNKFLEDHFHNTQWGANIVSELEITQDEESLPVDCRV